MRAVITGGRGFVGGHLARHLSDVGDEVHVIDREVDVTDRAFNIGRTGIKPGRVMLMEHETSMNMLDPAKRDKVYQADLETGSVVRTWNCKNDGVAVPMMDIANDSKGAQLDGRKTFLGLDANRMCRWDQRVKEGVVQGLQDDLKYVKGKEYAKYTNFTCMATSGDGYIAVGSKDGHVRLYGSRTDMASYEFNNALVAGPGLGRAVTSVDITFDGAYVLATTDKYLMVVQAKFQVKDKKGDDKDVCAFHTRCASQLPAPLLLKLRLDDEIEGAAFSNRLRSSGLATKPDRLVTGPWLGRG